MIAPAFYVVLYGAIFFSLFLIDCALGNGFKETFQGIYCKFACFIRRSIKKEFKQAEEKLENPLNLTTVLLEVFVLSLTVTFIRRYASYRQKDRIDDLLHDSRAALQQTNDFLEKWRLRRLNWSTGTDNYLDEEPSLVKPLKLEVPVLHMTVVDRVSLRNQPERADAGDAVALAHNDSPYMAVTSVLNDDDVESVPDPVFEECMEEARTIDFKIRYLWDLMEEDSNVED